MPLPGRVLSGVATTTRFAEVRHVAETDSTNRVLAAAAVAGAADGLVLVADHQTAGRGRLGRRWEAAPGAALLASVLLRPALAPDRYHLVSSAVALSAAAACRSVAGVSPALKWPNDLLLDAGKLAGILAEASAGAVVVGIGVNVASAPPGGASLATAAGHPVDRFELLGAVLEELDGRARDWDGVAREYAATCSTVGRRVRVEQLGRPPRVGNAVAVDGDGRLVVDFGGGDTEALAAADVVHLRPAGG